MLPRVHNMLPRVHNKAVCYLVYITGPYVTLCTLQHRMLPHVHITSAANNIIVFIFLTDDGLNILGKFAKQPTSSFIPCEV